MNMNAKKKSPWVGINIVVTNKRLQHGNLVMLLANNNDDTIRKKAKESDAKRNFIIGVLGEIFKQTRPTNSRILTLNKGACHG